MESALALTPTVKASVWTARVLGTLLVLFLLFDSFGKYTKPQPVVDAFARQGMPISLAPVIGTILLTGYLGGAVAVNMRASFSLFETVFPIIMGVLAWAPLYLTDERVRALL